ncbi:MAG: peptidyl-prolyl cis-trans isomerase [Proteobacteria bacterium]|nr:peptidyl-prolyl cis-trans isomerase [Pseudomonadota bacterium]
MSKLSAVLREPMLHFLIVGAGVFLLYGVLSGPGDESGNDITVSVGHVEHFVSVFLKTRQRRPTQHELEGLIDNYIVEELLYREAVAIGLDRDDTIVRRRMRQKMDFLLDDLAMIEPTNDQLQQLLDDQPERFRRDARFSFDHVYIADGDIVAAMSILEKLRSGELFANGDPIGSGLLPDRIDDLPETRVSALFGGTFTQHLKQQQRGSWTGPIESPYGAHLVRIDQIVESEVPSLEEIRSELRREWLLDRRRASRNAMIDALREKYHITIADYETPDS